jgi:hypothetical protein
MNYTRLWIFILLCLLTSGNSWGKEAYLPASSPGFNDAQDWQVDGLGSATVKVVGRLQGAGVLAKVGTETLILTNSHLLMGLQHAKVSVPSLSIQRLDAQVVFDSAFYDVALLKLNIC